MRSPRCLLGLGGVAVAAVSWGACANVIGLDGLEYDRVATSASGSQASSGTTQVGPASSGTDVGPASTGAGGDPSSGSGGDASSSSSGSGGAADYRLPQLSSNYLDLIKYYDGAIWRFDESAGALIAIDDGYYGFGGKNPTPSDWDGNYEAGSGTIVYGDQGAFQDDVSASFLGGARVTVPRQDPTPYAFEYLSDEGAFTLSALVFSNGNAPSPPVTIASCYDADADRGWIVRLGEDLVLERHGLDENGNPAVETNLMPVDNEAGWHLLTIEKLSGGGGIRGFDNGAAALLEVAPVVRTMEAHAGVLVLGADPEGDGSAPQLFLDDLFLIPYGLNDDQIDAQHECIQGGSCEPP